MLLRVGLIFGGIVQKGLDAWQGGSFREATLGELLVVKFGRNVFV